MARAVIKLRCPGCGDVFRWREEHWPKFCPLCGHSTDMPQRNEIQSPHVSAGRSKALLQSADQTYRASEKTSDANATLAAEIAGVPKSEMASLKITDMNTQLRQGDIAAKPIVNDVTRFMDHNRTSMQQVQANAMGYAAAAHTGKDAYAGARAFGSLREVHQQIGKSIVMANQKVAPGSAPSAPDMSTVVPTREVLDRTMRSGGKPSF